MEFQKEGGHGLTNYLKTPEAQIAFYTGWFLFMNFEVKYPENQAIYEQAVRYYFTIPSEYQAMCPVQ